MPTRGYPDFTQAVTHILTGGFAGLEELAARLKSIAPWDLRGNIVLMEDFESELTEWETLVAEGYTAATRSSRHKYSGDWAAKLHIIGGSDEHSILWRTFHFPGLSKYALFARLCWDEDCQIVLTQVDLFTGTQVFVVEVTYNLPLHTLSITKGLPTGSYIVDDDLYLGESQYAWFPLLITFDLETGYYDKLYFADKEYDISSVAIETGEPEANPHGLIRVEASTTTPGFDAYADDIVLAKNVP